MTRYGRKTVNAAKRKCNVDTGQARASLQYLVLVGPDRITVRVGSDLDHVRYLNEGTGIYGPRHRPIRPVSRKFLRFKSRGTFGPVAAGGRRAGRGQWVFARQVRGIPPHPFLWEALRESVPWPVIRNR